MADEARKTGIGIIGDVPWGTHFCHFYRAKEDLLRVLVPYFQAGLDNNEFCLWATSEPLGAEEARETMGKAMPGFAQYLERGQIEIMPHDQWYLQDGLFDSERVVRAWIDKLDRALAAGYSGMRASGNMSWLERKDWESFADYEGAINRVIGQRKMVVLCAYWLNNISAADIFEVAGSHTFAVVGRNGDLELVEGALYRKKAEEELRASEERYRLLVENAHEMVVVVQDGKAVFTNPRCAEVFGYTEEEMAARSFIEFIHPDNQGTVMEYYAKRLKGEHVPSTYSLRIIDKGGNAKWTEANTVLLTWKGRPAILGLVTDVTERKKAEEELRASEERNRLLINNANEGIVVIQDGKVVFGNPKYVEVSGFSEEEVMSRPFSELVHPDDIQMVMERYLKRLKGEEIPPTYAARVIDRAGNVKWVEANSVSISWNGRPAIMALVTDITERKKAEEALRESEKRYRLLFDVTPVVISVTTSEGRALSVNNAIREMSGYTPEEFMTLNMNDIYVDPVERRRMRALLQREGRVRDFETGFRRKDGSISIVLLNTDTIELDNQRLILATVRDITDRKRVEEGLLQSKALLNEIERTGMIGGWAFDAETLTQTWTEETFRILEIDLTKGEPKVPEGIDFIAPEFRPMADQAIQRAIEYGEPYDQEWEIITAKGNRKWVHSVARVRQEQGKTKSVAGSFQDITDRKQAEEALKKTYQLLNDTGEMAKVGGWELDLLTNEVSLTEEVCRIHGLEPGHRPKLEEALNFYAPESRSAVEAVVKKAAETGEPYDLESLFIPRGSKDKIWVRSLGKAVYSGGEIVKLVGTFQNIDKYKRAEKALRESEAQYRTLFDAMPVAVVIATPEGKVVSANDAVKGLSGYTREEFMAMDMKHLYVDPGERKRLLALLQKEGRVSDSEVMFRRKDGVSVCVLLNMDNLELRGQKLIMTTIRDITDLKQAEIRQRQANEQLILASRLASLGLLASGVAHEINNPLAVVMGCAQLALEKDTPEDVKEDLRSIADSAQQVADVVQRLLTFGRQSKLGKDYVDINALVSRVLRLRAREMSIHNVEVTTRLDPDLPRTMVDVGQMQQVFLNIILNAEQAMAKANKDGHFLVKTERTDDRITITFRDDGVGITKEDLPRLFDPFFTTKEVGEGMGLGLSISYGIVKEHGGRIYAKGQPGKGAAFMVELPILSNPVQPESAEKPADEPKEKVVGRILVVDDEPGICQLLRDLLTRDGHSVETVGDASVALEMVKHEQFNLILLDIKMKGMSGIDLYQQMGRIAESLQERVLFITGDTLSHDTRGFLDTTKAPHICKPFNIQQLRKIVNQILWSGRK